MNRAPENTLSSFKLALDFGADAIEMDIHWSGDRELAVLHDSQLERTTNRKGLVSSLTWKEIRRLDAGSWFSPRFKGEKIPCFSEVIQAFQTKKTCLGHPLGFVVELKRQTSMREGQDMARAVADELERYDVSQRSIVISFEHDYLLALRDRDLRTGILFSRKLSNPLTQAQRVGAKCLFPQKDLVSKTLVKSAREHGLKVYTWTANSKRDFLRLIRCEVDGITTNDPSKLLALLLRR